MTKTLDPRSVRRGLLAWLLFQRTLSKEGFWIVFMPFAVNVGKTRIGCGAR
jgi:hypothetical protein